MRAASKTGHRKQTRENRRKKDDMNALEQRFLQSCELRAVDEATEDNDDDFALEGYAATFGNESTDPGLGFKEVCMRGCFNRSVRSGADVRALFNHDPNKVLGRVKNGTLALKEDGKGLRFRVKLDRTNPEHKSIHSMIARGDVSDCSFGFIVPKGGDEWSDVRGTDGKLYAQRRLVDVDLMDVSACTYPAYGETSVFARSAMFWPNGIPAEVRSRVPRLASEKETLELSKEQLLTKIRGLSV